MFFIALDAWRLLSAKALPREKKIFMPELYGFRNLILVVVKQIGINATSRAGWILWKLFKNTQSELERPLK